MELTPDRQFIGKILQDSADRSIEERESRESGDLNSNSSDERVGDDHDEYSEEDLPDGHQMTHRLLKTGKK